MTFSAEKQPHRKEHAAVSAITCVDKPSDKNRLDMLIG